MSKSSLLNALIAASILGAGGAALSTPALADVVYIFDGNFLNSNSSPANASFSLTVPNFITSETTFSPSDLVCGDSAVTCTGVSFLWDSSTQQDVISINYKTLGSKTTESEYYYFASNVFYTDGTAHQQNTHTNNAKLTTNCTPVSATPEPSTWLLMIAGLGGVGLVLRQARRTTGLRLTDAI